MMSLGFVPQPALTPGTFHYGNGFAGEDELRAQEETSWMAVDDKEGQAMAIDSDSSSFPQTPPSPALFGVNGAKPEHPQAPPAFDKAALFMKGGGAHHHHHHSGPSGGGSSSGHSTTSRQLDMDDGTAEGGGADTTQALTDKQATPVIQAPFDPAVRTEEFVGMRIPAERDDEWRQSFRELQMSPFTDRPTTDELLENYMKDHKGMPRMLQPYQRVMRSGYDWRLSKRAPGVDLAFLRDQDKAFAELQEMIVGKPAKQGYQKAKPVHNHGSEVKRRVGGRSSRLHGGTLPVIEIREDGDIFIDGKLLIGTLYTKVMGLAYSEKACDPNWKIANGVVDRCYYQGSKRDARDRPGSFFPTDKAMVADFVIRHPELFMSPIADTADINQHQTRSRAPSSPSSSDGY